MPTHILVIYDVSDDGRRFELAAALKRLGLTRVQRSAFVGPCSSSLVSDVKNVSRRIIDPATDNVQVYPLTPASYRMRVVIGREFFDEEGDVAGGFIV
ncbi:MAG: CRISPR-associated endonuclease Cas2 [Candidatus Caldarchaeum sp.]|nr:CRISPR-associated endonuclease Cas2 [Candidatus Caldarchaeum sp.]MDW8360596.1 CRISPR-associated endonuclease Cas2 [Candidatus Caldarchaeum sp.]